jgi:hypothetical protein
MNEMLNVFLCLKPSAPDAHFHISKHNNKGMQYKLKENLERTTRFCWSPEGEI